MRNSPATLIVLMTILLSACQKRDNCPAPSKKDSTCDLVQSMLFIDALPEEDGGIFTEYRKEYGNDGKVSNVVAGLYTLRLYDSVAMRLKYKGSTIYFTGISNPADTFTTATFDSQGRLQKMDYGNTGRYEFITTEFFYDSGQLSGFLVDGSFNYHITYDAKGNVAHIYGNYDKVNEGLFFTYDYTVSAKRQWYTDHFPISGVSNSVYLAQFLGWLPDLEPKNKRNYWKYIYNDDEDDSTPPVIMEHTLTNHVYDSNGNLVSYKSDFTYTSTWSCEAKKSTVPN